MARRPHGGHANGGHGHGSRVASAAYGLPPLRDHDRRYMYPPAPPPVIPPPVVIDVAGHGRSGPFDRGRLRRHPSPTGSEDGGMYEERSTAGIAIYPEVYPDYGRGYGRDRPSRAHGRPSRPPSRSPSPEPYYEPALAPWAHYVDDKYTDEWTRLAANLRAYDENYVEDCKDDIDTLLVFAGLFSAVLTAFNIESYKNLQQDSGDVTSAAVSRISGQLSNLTVNTGTISSSQAPYSIPTFSAPASAVRINALWFSSLILSLISASLGMLVKQWLREYLSGQYTSPQERIRVRHYRWEGLHRWRVFEIAAILPILLQIALILFFIGLSDFLRQLNPIVGWLVTGLISLWLILFSIGTLAPAVSYRCPYKVPFLKNFTSWIRFFLSAFIRKGSRRDLPQYSLFPGDERGVRRDLQLDIPAVIGADKLYADDDFLERTLRLCMIGVDGHDTVRFVRGILGNRLDKEILSLTRIRTRDFDHLTTKALYTSMYIIIDVLKDELEVKDVQLSPWMHEALEFLFSALNYTYLSDRPIGDAMDSGLWLQEKLLVQDDPEIVRRTLILLAKYPYVRCVLTPMDTDAAQRVLGYIEELHNGNFADPISLLRVLLCITLLQPDLRTIARTASHGETFLRVLRGLTASIAARLVNGYPIDTLAFCLRLCTKLNNRWAGFIPPDVVETLQRHAGSPSKPETAFIVNTPTFWLPFQDHNVPAAGGRVPAVFPHPRLAMAQS